MHEKCMNFNYFLPSRTKPGKRERVEAHFSRLKRCIGPNLKTRKIESQKNEGIISGKILNYWNELGRCKTVRVA